MIIAQRFNAGGSSRRENKSPLGTKETRRTIGGILSSLPGTPSIDDGDEPSVETLGYYPLRFDGRRSASLPQIEHDIHRAMIARLR